MSPLFLLILFSYTLALSLPAKKTLSQLREMRIEAAELMDAIADPEQMDLIETILDREEEEEETNQINNSPLLVTASDLDDTSRSVLTRLREIKDEEKELLNELKSRNEFKTITAKLLREEIEHLEQNIHQKPVKAEPSQ